MAWKEGIGGRHRREVERIDLALLHHHLPVVAFPKARAQDGVVEDVGRSIRRNVDQLDGEVGVLGV